MLNPGRVLTRAQCWTTCGTTTSAGRARSWRPTSATCGASWPRSAPTSIHAQRGVGYSLRLPRVPAGPSGASAADGHDPEAMPAAGPAVLELGSMIVFPAGLKPRIRRPQLRTQVLAGVLLVTLAALTVFDATAISELRRYLLDRTDSNLRNRRSACRAGRRGSSSPAGRCSGWPPATRHRFRRQ